MTLLDQSQTEVRRLTTSLTKPKVNVNIGCWNVRTLYSIGKSAQLSEMDKYKIDVMGISECRWMGQGKVKMNTGESIIFLLTSLLEYSLSLIVTIVSRSSFHRQSMFEDGIATTA